MSEHLTPEYEAEIRERIDQLDDDRTFPNATWLASSASSKSVFPPAQSHVVEDVVETKRFVTRASVGVFGDKRHAEFTAHARDDIPTLLAEIDRLRAERDAFRAEVLREAADVAVRAARSCVDSEAGQYAASVAAGIGKELRRLAASSPSPDAGDKQPETEAHPRRDRWRVEIYDPLTKEWAPGIPLLVRERAVERLETAQIHSPRWADDDTPVARRLVRETTTYTVEAGESNV